MRDAKGEAKAGLPLTLVAIRPDGVEYKRTTIADQGLGGRSLALPLLAGAQSGSWRVVAYVDPKGPSVGETGFMLEDYIPERLDVKLKPAADILTPGEPVADRARREISLWRSRRGPRRDRPGVAAGRRRVGNPRLQGIMRAA